SRSASGPPLVGLAVARPQLDERVVGRRSTTHVQAQPRLCARDGAVGIDVPLLVRLPAAVPEHDLRAVGRLVVVGIQALAQHLQLLAAGVGPALVGATVAVPDDQLDAVGGGAARVVQAAVRTDATDDR